MRWPDAEVPVHEDLVRRLLEDQHPDLAHLPVALFDAGWDNVMWRLGDQLAVRMPRRLVAAPLILHEQRWLPELAARLPIAVPVPVRAGRPSSYYPWHWSVVPWFEGEPGDRTAAAVTGRSAGHLGAFLASLHRPAPPDAPHNPYRSGPISSRADTFEERMARLGPIVDEPVLRRVWDAAVSAPAHYGAPTWLHGDLHPANLLISAGAIVAVIDFGDLCAGDPACDLGAAWLSLRQGAMDRFWEAYGPVDPETVRRALGWAVLFGLMLLEIGLEGRPSYAEVGRAALDRIVGTGPGV